MDRCKENVIEWIEGDKTALCTFSQRRFITRIKRMLETHGKRVEILAENEDGSIMARIPLSAVHLTIYAPKRAGFEGVEDEDIRSEQSDPALAE